MFESPHRIGAAVSDMLEVCGPERLLTIARELTKRFEQIETMSLQAAVNALQAGEQRQQGEFVFDSS